MRLPNPDRSSLRWQADFARNRAFIQGSKASGPRALLSCIRGASAVAENLDGSTATFGLNAVRVTDRGIVIEPQRTELLTNSRLIVDPNGSSVLPVGWNATSTAVLEYLAGGEEGGVGWARVRITYTNPGMSPTTVRLNLEDGNGLTIGQPSGPFMGRQYAFSGSVTLEALQNGSEPSIRVTPRDAGGAIVVTSSTLGRVPITNIGSEQKFQFSSAFDDTVVTINPGFTYAANPGISSITLMVRGLGLSAGESVGSFIGTTPATVTRVDTYPNPTLAGASSPTTLPTGWSLGSGLSVGSVVVNPDSVDVQLNLAAGATGTLRLSPLTGATAIPANPGERFIGSVIATLISNPFAISAAVNLRARNAGGTSVSAVTSAPFSLGGGRTSTPTLTCAAGTAAVSLELAFGGVPSAEPSTVTIRFATPRVERLDAIPGSGPVLRDGDRVTLNSPQFFALPFTAVIEAEHLGLGEQQTLLSLRFGNKRVRVVTGGLMGAIVEELVGSSWFISLDLTKPPAYVAGLYRQAISLSGPANAAVLSVGFPDEADAGFESSATFQLQDTQPSLVTLGWSGDTSAPETANTVVRQISIQSGAASAAQLQLLTRRRWFPRHNAQPVSFQTRFKASTAEPFRLPTVAIAGAIYSIQLSDRSRYLERTHSDPMMDMLPAPASTGAGPNLPWFVALLNKSMFPIQVSTPAGNINSAGAIFILEAGQYRLFVTDGMTWVASGGAVNALDDPTTYQLVEFPSIYGPADSSDTSRSQIDLESYGVFQSRIGPIRQQSAYVTTKMNAWAKGRDGAEAARCGRCLLDWMVAGDYWRESGPGTPNDTINGQIVSNVGAYIGIRDAGVFTAAEDAAIRDKISRWAQQMIDYRAIRVSTAIAARDAGLRLVTGLQNHTYSYGYALALCAIALSRGDLFRRAYETWRVAIQDMQAIPDHRGALPNELVRASKGLVYQNLANIWLAGTAMVLRAYGVPIFQELNGGYLEIVNFTATAILTPSLIRNEQERLAALPITGLNSPIVPADQESLSKAGAGSAGDIPGESKTAWVWLLYRLLETAQASWRPAWRTILADFENCYATNLNGGLRDALYPALLVPEATLPQDQRAAFDNAELSFDNPNFRFDQGA